MFGISGANPLTCLGRVDFRGLNGVGKILGSVDVAKPRPSGIVASVDGMNPGVLDNK